MKIGIIAAMEDELSLLIEKLEKPTIVSLGRFTCHTGKIMGIEAALFLCGIGKVNASVGTTLLLEKFKPDCLINVGVAGGLADHIQVGDVVISSEVRHYDADATAFAYEIGQIPQMPAAYIADQTLLNLARKAAIAGENSAVHYGAIISGDSFIHTARQIDFIAEKFPDVMAIEMEGAAIAQTGFLFNVPFILIRSISDKVRKPGNSTDYERFMKESAENSIKIVLSMLKELHSENMSKIASFRIDHTRLKRGIYASRKDRFSETAITTFDLRLKVPNLEKALSPAASHTIEHICATFLRNHPDFGKKVIYFGPMGCLTGFYLLLSGEHDSRSILPLIKETFRHVADYSGVIPGATAVECGNHLLMDIEQARLAAERYYSEVLELVDDSNLVYPCQSQRL